MESIRRKRTSHRPNASIAAAMVLVALGLITSTAQATIVTQTIPFDHTGGLFPQFTIDYFDTMGGSRMLTGVTIELDGVADLDVSAENLSNTPANGWFLDAAILPRFELLNAEKTSFGIGASPYPLFSANLAASDGEEGSGPDFIQFPTGSVNLHGDIDLNPIDFGIFEGAGSVDAMLALPLSFAIPPLLVDFSTDRHEVGSLVVTYEYVPEPSTLALLSIGGTLLVRRKR
ncbi:MAG: hypothetical protein DHS20C16_12700 [Phycisphaerae bacterium]|nr:MAG: hypothetical protein DHS20C16_12700 [Phycisphaerae bacterium]